MSDRHIIWLWTVVALLCALCLLFGGCKSRQCTAVVVQRDSVVYSFWYDTTHVCVYDTIVVEVKDAKVASDSTDVVFVAEGGSYNLHTGQAEGVVSIRTSRREQELSQLTARQTTLLEAHRRLVDSLQQVVKSRESQIESKENTDEIKPKVSGWHRFLVWWFWVSVVLIVLWLAWQAWNIYRKYWLHI